MTKVTSPLSCIRISDRSSESSNLLRDLFSPEVVSELQEKMLLESSRKKVEI